MSQTTERLEWWLQLVECTAFENSEKVATTLGLNLGGRVHIRWDAASPMPDRINGSGDHMSMPDLEQVLEDVQQYLTDREFMILQLTRDNASYSPSVSYHVVTKRIVAKISGDELVERAKQLVLASEEELLGQDKTS